jgi:hypothetical protein
MYNMIHSFKSARSIQNAKVQRTLVETLCFEIRISPFQSCFKWSLYVCGSWNGMVSLLFISVLPELDQCFVISIILWAILGEMCRNACCVLSSPHKYTHVISC